MYLDHFELRERPFQLTPDADFLYLSTQHSLAQAYLNYSILNRDSFVVITGEIGAGKTTLVNRLLADVGDHVVTGRIFQTQLSPVQFLQALLVEFGFKPYGMRKVELLAILDNFLIEQYEAGRQVLLIVDEAQNLSERVLEELRLLSEVDAPKKKILSVVLLGQPDLRDKLQSPGLSQLMQRVRYRFHIGALSQVETEEYIEHRLQVAGREAPGLFSDEAIALVYEYTGGIPRLINILCDTALTGTFAEGRDTVGGEIVQVSLAELDWVPFAERDQPQGSPAAQPSPPASRFVLDTQGEAPVVYPMRGDRVMIGRAEDNDLTVQAEFVSRHHAAVTLVDGTCWLTDLNSTNGSYVNGRRVNRRALRHGDMIQLGHHRIRYENDQGGSAPALAPAADLQQWRETTVLDDTKVVEIGPRKLGA